MRGGLLAKKKITKNKSVWKVLSRIDCSQYVEKKGRFNYLSWSWAWGILKEHYPKAKFKYIKTEDGKTAFKDEAGYAFVTVAVTVEDETVEEDLAVMDNRNQDIKNPKPTDINNSLKRCLVKAMAFHGLGINVYAGEDLLMFDDAVVDENEIGEIEKEIVLDDELMDDVINEKQERAIGNFLEDQEDGADLLQSILDKANINHLRELSQKHAEACISRWSIKV